MKTNKWMANYVYKRFKFLNSKPISQGITLAFLGVWHGFHSGYYLIFLNEFLVTSLENDLFTTFQVQWIGRTLHTNFVSLMFDE